MNKQLNFNNNNEINNTNLYYIDIYSRSDDYYNNINLEYIQSIFYNYIILILLISFIISFSFGYINAHFYYTKKYNSIINYKKNLNKM